MIDSHCHLADDAYVDDVEAVVARARDADVRGLLCILAAENGTELERGAALAARWPEVRLATGVHPHQAGVYGGDPAGVVDVVEKAALRTGAVAIGEIGLDYHYDFAPREVQQAVFREQLRLAGRLGLPAIIHTREAEADTFTILQQEEAHRLTVVFHCFTGDRAMAQQALDLGAYLSFSGIVTFPKAEELRAVARIVPLDRLLVETDSPYLAPVPHRGTRNEPAWVRQTLERVAEVRGEDPSDLSARTHQTFDFLFASGTSETLENH